MKRDGDESSARPDTIEISPESLRRLIAEVDLVEAAVQAAVRDALILHKRAGQPIVVWEEGRVVLIPADEIEIPDEAGINERDS